MTLYIIGNGFDLAHDIKSSYSDFKTFMSKNHNYEMGQIEPLFESSDVDLWADFETALGKIDPNSVVRAVEAEARIQDPDELGHQSIFMSDMVSQACETLQTIVESHFAEWVRLIDITRANAFLQLDPDARYLSFNYTETLESIYHILPDQIVYIHNCRTKASPIVGHGNKQCIPYTGPEWIGSDEVNNSIQYVSPQMYKDVPALIKQHRPFFKSLNNITEIYIYGHSLNDIDLPYFQEIKKNVTQNAIWTVSYYSDQEKNEFSKILHNKLSIPMIQINLVTLDDPSLQLP